MRQDIANGQVWAAGFEAGAKAARAEDINLAQEYDDHVCFTEKRCNSERGCAVAYALLALPLPKAEEKTVLSPGDDSEYGE